MTRTSRPPWPPCSPDGSLLSSASLDGSVRLFSAATGEPKAALAAPPAHCLAYSPTGHVLATGGEGGMVQLWDPTTGVQVGHGPAIKAGGCSDRRGKRGA